MNPSSPSKPDPTKIGSHSSFDQQIWDDITELIKTNDIGSRELIEEFILYLRRVNFSKLLAHIEIFRHVKELPGSIVECGVFKGVSLLTFLKLLDIHCPGDTLRRIVGFDTFEGFTGLHDLDGPASDRYGKTTGGWDASGFYDVLEKAIQISQRDSMIPRFKRVELVKGDVCITVPKYVEQNPGLRISLLHLDLDLYEPTLTALKHLYPLVVSGGVVLLDEYAMEGFPGESKAFDDFFGHQRPKMTKFPFISTPGGYFMKEG